MFAFVQQFFATRPNPIGVDFGSDALRLAQVQGGPEPRLVAAACADVPPAARVDPAGRRDYFIKTCRDLLAQGHFRGRQAILNIPSWMLHIHHIRLGKMDDSELAKALQWELRGKLPFDPGRALIRHLVAGEVYQEQEAGLEVIVLAAPREQVEQLLDCAAKARLEVIGMNVGPRAMLDCFAHVYRRASDAKMTSLFVEMGFSGTRVVAARADQMLFARNIPIGSDSLNSAVAQDLHVGGDEARLLRLRLAARFVPVLDDAPGKRILQAQTATLARGQQLLAQAPGGGDVDNSFALLHRAPDSTAPGPLAEDDEALMRVEQCCQRTLGKLVEELNLCRRYCEATFPDRPLDRAIFTGGEANQRGLCQWMARQLGLAAQIGDPLVRMARVSEVGMESGIDRRLPQPGWTVALGLSLGAAVREVVA